MEEGIGSLIRYQISDIREQRTESREQRAEDREQRSESRDRRAEGRDQFLGLIWKFGGLVIISIAYWEFQVYLKYNEIAMKPL